MKQPVKIVNREKDIAEVRSLTKQIRETLKDEPADQFVHTAYEMCDVLEAEMSRQEALTPLTKKH